MLDFTSPPFAIAGLLAAAGPVIVHLLNRRRHRVIHWGAMDFLREAMQRQRKTLELRDLILLALRMLAVIALGVGLSRPFLRGASSFGPVLASVWFLLLILAAFSLAGLAVVREPQRRWWAGVTGVATLLLAFGIWSWSTASSLTNSSVATTSAGAVHAILLLDNSRSMGVATAAGTALDRGLAQARKFIDQLPADSRITLIPLAGTIDLFPQDPFNSREDARRALEQIRLVDASADLIAGLEQAEQASRQTPDLPAQRVVVWSDMQAQEWTDIDWAAWSQRLPDMQIVPLVEQPARNLAITDLSLDDGFAGTELPARFLVRVAASTSLPAPVSAEVLMTFDGTSTGSQLVELSPGQTREVEFLQPFDVPGEPGRPNWVLATAELQPSDPESDQLAADNRWSMTVPVVDTVPVVFVDQYGAQEEDLARSQIGETHALRHLLAPKSAAVDVGRRTVQIQHVTPAEVTQTLLESARLVVVAGVESPAGMVELLHDFVDQGGPLVILAGGAFDPEEWNAEGQSHGKGVLPFSLLPDFHGTLPESTAELKPFFADFRSMQNELFLVEGEDPEVLRDLFETLPFFQAVRFDTTQPATFTAESGDEHAPQWWLWRASARTSDAAGAPARVLASFSDNTTPWVIEQRIGRGRLVWFTSGVSSDWNLLRTSPAMYVFHRLMARLMSETLPARNFSTIDRITFPVPSADAQRYQLTRPAGFSEGLTVEAIDAGATGVIVRRPLTAGAYQIQSTAVAGQSTETTSLRFSVQPPPSESDLSLLTPADLRSAIGVAPIRILNVDELPRVTGGAVRGQSLWRWLLTAMLCVLLIEMAILALPAWRRSPA